MASNSHQIEPPLSLVAVPPTPTTSASPFVSLPVVTPASTTSAPLPPYTSAPIADQDPQLLTDIYTAINTSIGLVARERQILHAVLPCIPVTQSDQCRRMLALPLEHLCTLAQVLEAGLIIARNKGGRGTGISTAAKIYSRTPGNESPVSPFDYDPENPLKRQRVDPGVSTPTTSPPQTLGPNLFCDPAYAALLSALSLESVLPTPTPLTHVPRRQSLTTGLEARQSSTCAISGHHATTGAWIGAHLVPHSIASLRTMQDTPYWLLLTLVFGQTFRDTVFSIIAGERAHATSNGIGFSSDNHDMFDSGRFWLLPALTAPYDPAMTRHYDVVFRWRGNLRDLAVQSTVLAVSPDEQIDNSGRKPIHRTPGLRNVRDGDMFRLFTTDPEQFPLPHPALLELHARLWNMLANSGLSQTAVERDRRGGELGMRVRHRGSGGVGGGGRARTGRGSRGSESGGGSSRGGSAGQTPRGESRESSSTGHTINGESFSKGRGYGFDGSGRMSDQYYPAPSGSEYAATQFNSFFPYPTNYLDNQPGRPLPLETEYLIFKLHELSEKQVQQERVDGDGDEDLWEDANDEMEYDYNYEDGWGEEEEFEGEWINDFLGKGGRWGLEGHGSEGVGKV